MNEDQAQEVATSIENGEFINENLEFITKICNDFGYKLEKDKEMKK